jgi:hypothetical protein
MFVDRDLTMKYTKKIVDAIWGSKSFSDFPPPNRRLDMFFKSKHLSLINETSEDRSAFESAFNFLKQKGFIKVIKVEGNHISSTYFDSIDIFCYDAQKVATECFVSLTEKGLESWYEFRKTGKWERDSEKT